MVRTLLSSFLVSECRLQFSENFLYGVLLRDLLLQSNYKNAYQECSLKLDVRA